MLHAALYALAFLLLVALFFWVLDKLGLPEQIRKVIYIAAVVVVVIVVVVWLVQLADGGATLPSFGHRG